MILEMMVWNMFSWVLWKIVISWCVGKRTRWHDDIWLRKHESIEAPGINMCIYIYNEYEAKVASNAEPKLSPCKSKGAEVVSMINEKELKLSL